MNLLKVSFASVFVLIPLVGTGTADSSLTIAFYQKHQRHLSRGCSGSAAVGLAAEERCVCIVVALS